MRIEKAIKVAQIWRTVAVCVLIIVAPASAADGDKGTIADAEASVLELQDSLGRHSELVIDAIKRTPTIADLITRLPNMRMDALAKVVSMSTPLVQTCQDNRCFVIAYSIPYDVYFYWTIAYSGGKSKALLESIDVGAGETLRDLHYGDSLLRLPSFLVKKYPIYNDVDFIYKHKFTLSDVKQHRRARFLELAQKNNVSQVGDVEYQMADQWIALNRIYRGWVTLDAALRTHPKFRAFQDCNISNDAPTKWAECVGNLGIKISVDERRKGTVSNEYVFTFFKLSEPIIAYDYENSATILMQSKLFSDLYFIYPQGNLIDARYSSE